MFSKLTRRWRSLLLTLVVILSMMPMDAFAEEAEGHSHTENATVLEMTDAVLDIQNRMDAIVNQYGITAGMTDGEIANAIAMKDGDTVMGTMEEIRSIEADGKNLHETELLSLDVDLYSRFCNVLEMLFNPMMVTNQTVLGGKITVADSANSSSVSNDTVTITAKGSLFGKKTNNVTITNTGGKAATVSFNYTASTYSSFTVAGANKGASGTYTASMTAGESVALSIVSNSGLSNTTAKLVLSNFNWVEAASGSTDITFTFEGSKGSVTVAGETITSGAVKSIPASGAVLVATPASGNTFLGWINTSSGEIISSEKTYTFTPSVGMTGVQAVFLSASDTAWFSAGNGAYLFNDLTKACTYANSAAVKTIVLVNNGTLTGTHTIPAGVTLLVPYDAANTLRTTSPTVNDASVVAPTAYRTLTMASGAAITVNGGISVGGSQTAAYPVNGQATGPVGVIKMNSGSSITVNNGGKLYAWGYVAGSGEVTVKSGGTVYEDFQVADYRGGDVTSTLAGGTNASTWHIFPMSQYYVQNVQVPMKLEAGATETCYFSVTASLMGIKSESVNFIGANSMFQITNGYIIKDYDETTDRLNIDVYGTMEVNPFAIDIQVKGFSSAITIDSAKYDMPLNSNITINLNGTSVVELNQSLLMLPGSEINIGEEAKLNVNGGKRLIVYDREQWINGRSGDTTTSYYCSDLNKPLVQLKNVFNGTKGAAPVTRAATTLVDAKLLVNGELNAAEGYVYTTADGGNICSSGNGTVILQETPDANAYQIDQKRNGNDDFKSDSELDTHPITSAQLQNSNGSYTKSSDYGPGTYNYFEGYWHKDGKHAMTNGTCSICGQTYEAMVGNTYYTTLEDAANTAYSEITLLGNVTVESFNLNGCTVNCGNYSITVAGGGTIIDSATNGYGDGGVINGKVEGLASGICTVTSGEHQGKRYLVINDGSTTVAPRVGYGVYKYKIQAANGNPKVAYLSVMGVFRGNTTAISKLAAANSLGFVFNKDITYYTESDGGFKATAVTADTPVWYPKATAELQTPANSAYSIPFNFTFEADPDLDYSVKVAVKFGILNANVYSDPHSVGVSSGLTDYLEALQQENKPEDAEEIARIENFLK